MAWPAGPWCRASASAADRSTNRAGWLPARQAGDCRQRECRRDGSSCSHWRRRSGRSDGAGSGRWCCSWRGARRGKCCSAAGQTPWLSRRQLSRPATARAAVGAACGTRQLPRLSNPLLATFFQGAWCPIYMLDVSKEIAPLAGIPTCNIDDPQVLPFPFTCFASAQPRKTCRRWYSSRAALCCRCAPPAPAWWGAVQQGNVRAGWGRKQGGGTPLACNARTRCGLPCSVLGAACESKGEKRPPQAALSLPWRLPPAATAGETSSRAGAPPLCPLWWRGRGAALPKGRGTAKGGAGTSSPPFSPPPAGVAARHRGQGPAEHVAHAAHELPLWRAVLAQRVPAQQQPPAHRQGREPSSPSAKRSNWGVWLGPGCVWVHHTRMVSRSEGQTREGLCDAIERARRAAHGWHCHVGGCALLRRILVQPRAHRHSCLPVAHLQTTSTRHAWCGWTCTATTSGCTGAQRRAVRAVALLRRPAAGARSQGCCRRQGGRKVWGGGRGRAKVETRP